MFGLTINDIGIAESDVVAAIMIFRFDKFVTTIAVGYIISIVRKSNAKGTNFPIVKFVATIIGIMGFNILNFFAIFIIWPLMGEMHMKYINTPIWEHVALCLIVTHSCPFIIFSVIIGFIIIASFSTSCVIPWWWWD